MNLFILLGFGLLLGVKHAFDADHIIAVSNLLRKVRSLNAAIRLGVSWAAGHMLTATIITVLLYVFRESILSSVLSHFEIVVGVMLIVLGIISIREFFVMHRHQHAHGYDSRINRAHTHLHAHAKGKEATHAHKHIFGIGIIHGLASNDELLILFAAALGVTTLGGILLSLAFFSVGVVLGMVAFACFFVYPLLKVNNDTLSRYVSLISGMVGMVYGSFMILALV